VRRLPRQLCHQRRKAPPPGSPGRGNRPGTPRRRGPSVLVAVTRDLTTTQRRHRDVRAAARVLRNGVTHAVIVDHDRDRVVPGRQIQLRDGFRLRAELGDDAAGA
jgi:hypothetical protein